MRERNGEMEPVANPKSLAELKKEAKLLLVLSLSTAAVATALVVVSG